MGDKNDHQTRRRVLQSLGATSAVALAGCGQQDGNGNGNGGNGGGQQQELGERVPPVVLSWYGTVPRAPILKKHVNVVAEDIEKLGVEPDIQPMSTGAIAEKFLQDKFDGDLPHIIQFNVPQRVDPHRLLTFIGMIEGVGAPPSPVELSQWASCEYRDLVYAQSTEPDPEERQKIVTEALNMSTEEVSYIPITNLITLNAIRTDKVEPRSVGQMGGAPTNVNFFLDSSPKDGDSINFQIKPIAFETIQPTRVGEGKPLWNGLINSTLAKYNQDLEIENYLATSIEKENGGKEIVVEIRDDVTFHNGEKVTAEDVKWSFDYVANYPGGVREILPWPHKSIEVIDDTTVRFIQKAPSIVLTALNFVLVGIWHKESLIEAGATENPSQYQFSEPTDLVGSGPFQIDHAEPGSTMTLVPYDDHPDSPDHNLVVRGFDEKTTAVQAFKSGELHTIVGIQPQLFQQLRERDNVQGVEAQGWTQHGLAPQMSAPPSKFRAFREAISVSLNRTKMNQIAQAGLAQPQLHGGVMPDTNPWFEKDKVPNVAESPQGDPEAARQILADAGWGWDDNDNLHYPPDADLTRRWPKDEGPDPANYPCLGTDDKGNRIYVPPNER